MDEQKTSQYLRMEQGCLHYHDVGNGPCMLLIHGSGPGVSAWGNFHGNLATFAKHFRCIAINLPGYGESDARDGDPVEEAVLACLQLMRALEIDSVHIIGNSLGGIVGSHIAAQYPEKVSSFISIGGIGLNLFSSFPAEGLNLLSKFVETPNRENMTTWLQSMVYDQSLITDNLIEQRFQKACEPKALATSQALYSKNAIANIAQKRTGVDACKTIEHLSAIQAPTLLAWGREDRVSPLDISLIPMRLIPNCELHVFPQCGHWAMIECKQRFESLVLGFIGDL